jgi:hypothetical protein
MKRVEQIVWVSDSGGTELLKKQDEGKYYIPLSTIDVKIARELRDALSDMLAEPMISAMARTQKEGK